LNLETAIEIMDAAQEIRLPFWFASLGSVEGSIMFRDGVGAMVVSRSTKLQLPISGSCQWSRIQM